MKVKIGNKVYDSNKEPIMLILNKKDKENIRNMHLECNKFCSFPDTMDRDIVLKWMDK